MSPLAHDTLDDRREAHRLLARLGPQQRCAFVQECCDRLPARAGLLRPRVLGRSWSLAERARWCDEADRRLSLDLYFDLWHLAVQWGLDMDWALTRLESLVRRPGGHAGHGRSA